MSGATSGPDPGTSDGGQQRSDSSGSGNAASTGPAELVVGVLGGLVVAAVLVFLGYQAWVVREDPARLRTSVVAARSAAAGNVVRYEVHNDGGETAEAVHVVGELLGEGQVVETVSGTLAYVPADSVRRGALVFRHDLGDGRVRVRAVSYNLP